MLVYHNVIPDDCPPFGDRSLHVTRRVFVRQLEDLLRTHTVVPLDEILQPAARRASRPRVALTFDDAYRGAVVLGVEELARRGLPGTVFVAPAFVGGGPFWWDALSSASGGGLDGTLREHAIDVLRGADGVLRSWAKAEALPLAPVPESGMVASLDELQAAARHPGITLGSHSWAHLNLTRVSDSELEQELRRSREWLEARFRSVSRCLSYPYGLHNPTVEAAARAAGYDAAVGLAGGLFSPLHVNRYAVPRLNIPAGLSASGFTVRTSGLVRGSAVGDTVERRQGV